MCGIAGFSGTFSTNLFEHASRSIAHRGPDAERTWFNRKTEIGMAHRRLPILDLSPVGDQPMAGSNGAVVMVFNGEICLQLIHALYKALQEA